jgi:phage gp36-like protein
VAYCDTDDLILAYTRKVIEELAVDTAGDDLDSDDPQAVIDRAIADAQAEVDAALAPHYETPLDDDNVPDMARRLTASLAFNRLVLRVRRTIDEDDQLRYDAVKRDLDAIRTGAKTVPGLTMTRGLATAVAMREPTTAEATRAEAEDRLARGF